jgi:hypothetical protein
MIQQFSHLLAIFITGLSLFLLSPSFSLAQLPMAPAESFADGEFMKWVGVPSDLGGAVSALQLVGELYESASKVSRPTINITSKTFSPPSSFYVGDQSTVKIEITANWVLGSIPARIYQPHNGPAIISPQVNFHHYVQLNFYLDDELVGAYRNNKPSEPTYEIASGDFKFEHLLEARTVGEREFRAVAKVRGRVIPSFLSLIFNPYIRSYSDVIEDEESLEIVRILDPFNIPVLQPNPSSSSHGAGIVVNTRFENKSPKNGFLKNLSLYSSEIFPFDTAGILVALRNNTPLQGNRIEDVIPAAQVPHLSGGHPQSVPFFAKAYCKNPTIILHDLQEWSSDSAYNGRANFVCNTSAVDSVTYTEFDFTDIEKLTYERIGRVFTIGGHTKRNTYKNRQSPASTMFTLKILDHTDSSLYEFQSDDSGRFLITGEFGPLISMSLDGGENYNSIALDSFPSTLINLGSFDTMRLYPKDLPPFKGVVKDYLNNNVDAAVYLIRNNDTTFIDFVEKGNLFISGLNRLDVMNGSIQLCFKPDPLFNTFYKEQSISVTINTPFSFDTIDVGIVNFEQQMPKRTDSLLVFGILSRYIDSVTKELLQGVKVSFYDSVSKQIVSSFEADDSGMFFGMIPRQPLRMIVHVGDLFPSCISNDTVPTIDFTHSLDTMIFDDIHYYVPCEMASIMPANLVATHTQSYIFSRSFLTFIPDLVVDDIDGYSLYNTIGQNYLRNVPKGFVKETISRSLSENCR